jgi:hypothetical protein
MKFETRDFIGLAALGLPALALCLEAAGSPTPDWLRAPLSTAVTVVLGFYFVDSARRGLATKPGADGGE